MTTAGKASKASLGLVSLFLAAIALAGCNTVAGMGRDLAAAGDAVAHAAVMASGPAPATARGPGAVSGTTAPTPLR